MLGKAECRERACPLTVENTILPHLKGGQHFHGSTEEEAKMFRGDVSYLEYKIKYVEAACDNCFQILKKFHLYEGKLNYLFGDSYTLGWTGTEAGHAVATSRFLLI